MFVVSKRLLTSSRCGNRNKISATQPTSRRSVCLQLHSSRQFPNLFVTVFGVSWRHSSLHSIRHNIASALKTLWLLLFTYSLTLLISMCCLRSRLVAMAGVSGRSKRSGCCLAKKSTMEHSKIFSMVCAATLWFPFDTHFFSFIFQCFLSCCLLTVINAFKYLSRLTTTVVIKKLNLVTLWKLWLTK